MDNQNKIVIKNADGSTLEVKLVTYLVSEDNSAAYLVFSKGEISGAEEDEIVYISRININGDKLELVDITDDNEWGNVQKLLKQVANA